MFSMLPRKRAVARRAGGEGGALMPLAFPLFRGALLPEFDRLFDGFLREWELPTGNKAWRWEVAVEDKEAEVVVRAEAPGFKPEDFEVEARDEMLVLRAVREMKPEAKEKVKKEGEKVEYERDEFYEAIPLPALVSGEKATAKYVHGVLTVTLPKAEGAKGRRVPVTTT